VPHADFPPCLVAEAVGQLAAWVAMENRAFSSRPVAAIVGELAIGEPARTGATLDLTVEISAIRTGAMRYGGRASVDGRTVLELRRCTGAMLPMDVFDDPARVRAQFERLRAEGEAERSFPAFSEFAPRATRIAAADGELAVELEAPQEAAFYADHFPRRAVYPATLLLDAKVRVAQELLQRDGPGATPPEIRALRNAKVRAFTPPGGRVRVVARRCPDESDANGEAVRLEAFAEEERVSAVTVWLSSEPPAAG